MELVDIYNDKHEKMNYTKGRKELVDGEFRLSCFVWIINDKDELLIQQRLATAKKCPNMWETASGGAKRGEDAITCVLRELEEELGIKANKEDLKFIGSYARINDFVEVFLLKTNIDPIDLKLQEDEVQAVKWVSISEFESIIENGDASDTGYFIFKEYYEKFYNRYLVFEDGKPVFKKKDKCIQSNIKISDLYCVNENVNLDDYLKLYKYVKDNMESPSWLGDFTKEEIEELLKVGAKIWLYYSNNDLVCSMFMLPSSNKTLNKNNVSYDEKECASLGPIMVSKDYVGNKLQLQMMEELEKYCRNNNYKYIFTKVASDNKYSLSNMLKFGFKITNEYINERGKNSTLIKEIK